MCEQVFMKIKLPSSELFNPVRFVLRRGLIGLIFISALWFCGVDALLAQELNATREETPVVTTPTVLEVVAAVVVQLPDSEQMAIALARQETRNKTLLDLAAARHVVDHFRRDPTATSELLAKEFREDRGWLARLINRYGWVEPHSGILDPAAWSLSAELRDLNLPVMALVRPDSTPTDAIVSQVFQRSNERLASSNLPILLYRIEQQVMPVWNEFLTLVNLEGSAAVQWQAVEAEWFTEAATMVNNLPSQEGQGEEEQTQQALAQVEQIQLKQKPALDPLQELSLLAASSVQAGPPAAKRLQDLREFLLRIEPSEDTSVEDIQNVDILRVAIMVDGLQDGRYFEFVRGLLAMTTSLLGEVTPTTSEQALVGWFVKELPPISAHYAKAFAQVDPRLNVAMAGIYKVLKIIDNPVDTPANFNAHTVLANAVAQLALMIPDMGFYFNTPVRVRIADKIMACTRLAADRDAQGFSSMDRGQFDSCIDGFLQLAETRILSPELAGNVAGPFRTDSMLRELNVTPDQRINYHVGFLHDKYPNECTLPATAIPNPLEWALLATTMVWFAEYSPEFFNTPENESRLARMRTIGEQLSIEMARQVTCFSGDSLRDPVSRIMVDYDSALRQLDAGIAIAEADFRGQNLKVGADVKLDKGAAQITSYSPENLVIIPCDQRNVCEMTGNLSATRALIGLFPNEYLVAEQTGLGNIEICYRNMEWVDRRSELVRPDDENVANYYGHLAFDLVGRYTENENSQDLFGFRFTSPDEQHYLFAQASDEVLQDSCPTEWVGTKVVTPLRENRSGIVPDRLTYLAASRALPSRLLQTNWDKGSEWRDWFVTGIGVTPLEMPPAADIMTPLGQHLQALYQREQAEIYQRLLLPTARNAKGEDVSLYPEMSQVSLDKNLMRIQMMLFYPRSLTNSDDIRQAVAGDAGLLERRTMRRFKEDNVPFTTVSELSRQRLTRLKTAWDAQPQALRQEGSIPVSLMYAMTRINNTYRQFFTTAPAPLDQP
jgi:hypothetical protein